MKKALAAILLAGLAALIIAGIANSGNDNKTDNTPKATQPAPTSPAPSPTTTTEDNSAIKSFCTQKASEISDLYGQYSALLPGITTISEAQAALETGRALEDASNAWLNTCGSYFPTEAASIRSSLAEFSAALDRLEQAL